MNLPLSMAAALVLAALSAGQGHGAARPVQDADERSVCCFKNSRYSGVCEVEPGEGETCASILGYLNNPQSQGKSYCGSTSVRGGWRKVACKSE
jgi:hypothetical protein